jgi:hypothetical protein
MKRMIFEISITVKGIFAPPVCLAFVLWVVMYVIKWKRLCLNLWRQKASVCKCIVSLWMRECIRLDRCHQILKLDLGHFNCCYIIFDVIIWPFHSHLNLGLQVLRLGLHPPYQLSPCLTPCDTQILINGLGNWSSVETHAMIFKLPYWYGFKFLIRYAYWLV